MGAKGEQDVGGSGEKLDLVFRPRMFYVGNLQTDQMAHKPQCTSTTKLCSALHFVADNDGKHFCVVDFCEEDLLSYGSI